MEFPEPEQCIVCDFGFDPYQRVIVVLAVTIGGDGRWYLDRMNPVHAHCWSNHVTILQGVANGAKEPESHQSPSPTPEPRRL